MEHSMKKCMLISQPSTKSLRARLRSASSECPVVFEDECTAAELKAYENQITAIFGEPDLEDILRYPNLQWIQMGWAGVDIYSAVKESFPKQVILSNATGCYGAAISEFMMATLLSMCQKLGVYGENQRNHLWQREFPTLDIEEKKALILGAGDIGSQFAKRLKAFGVYTIGVRRTQRDKPEEFDEMHTLDELDALLPQVDIVGCSLPNTENTRGLLDEKRLRAMKADAVLINVGRGNLIVTDDLVTVLQSGHLFGVALDVVDPEPLGREHPLWDMKNVIITPHSSGMGFGNSLLTERKITDLCVENIRKYGAGEEVGNQVDLEVGYCKGS